jgi:L,D-transpeptidase ErfK/SrfK
MLIDLSEPALIHVKLQSLRLIQRNASVGRCGRLSRWVMMERNINRCSAADGNLYRGSAWMHSRAVLCLGILAALVCSIFVRPAFGGAPALDGDIVGEPAFHVTTEDDTLLDLARSFDVGFVQLRAANPDVDPWRPGRGVKVVIPTAHILPPAPRNGIIINLAEMRLYAFFANREPRTYPVGIGREGYATPLGTTVVARKTVWPSWRPTAPALREDPDLPAYVAPGPDNPMGIFAVYLGWPHYAIHDTPIPDSVGRRSSDGCIRLYREDAEELYPLVEPGTPVRVVDQPLKLGWHRGELYLEAHPTQVEVDEIEAHGRVAQPFALDGEAQVAAAAGRSSDRIDWYTVATALLQRSGVPVKVTRTAAVAMP